MISGNINGIVMNSDSDDVVEGNYIGTDPTGTLTIGNGTVDDGGGNGVLIQYGVGDTIGGAMSSSRDLISGNVNGVMVEYASSVDNVIAGNYIGTDPTGTIAVSNVGHGVLLESTGGGNTIGGGILRSRHRRGNLIAGNLYGISLAYEPSGGHDPRQRGRPRRVGWAVHHPATRAESGCNTARESKIGGTNPQDANVILGNTGGVGLAIGESGGVVVQGNFVGTNFGGTAAVPNGVGVSIEYSSNNTIGGTTAGAGNVISGNTDNGLGIVDGSGLGDRIWRLQSGRGQLDRDQRSRFRRPWELQRRRVHLSELGEHDRRNRDCGRERDLGQR